jgi:hypothetical protein
VDDDVRDWSPRDRVGWASACYGSSQGEDAEVVEKAGDLFIPLMDERGTPSVAE